MIAIDFINKGIHVGDEIRLFMNCILNDTTDPIEGVFGGYKTFGDIETDLTFGLYPVFYRKPKNGRIKKTSIFGRGCVAWCRVDNIRDIEKLTRNYRLLGFYDNDEDCRNLAPRGPRAILEAWKTGEGDRVIVDSDGAVYDDIYWDRYTSFIQNGRYAIRITGAIAGAKAPAKLIEIFERVDL